MEFEKESALIEAILFLESEPVTEKSLSAISELSEEVVRKSLEVLKEKYKSDASGIELEMITGGWALIPKKEIWNVLKERYGNKNEGKLSRSAMETLSIIAYSQPVTRAEIESIRGVSADNMIRLLMERNLIKEVDKKDIPGKPSLYGTTKEFLKFFRLNSIADLPKLDEAEEERFELAR
ncbi:MAG: SMC-Scp complex subunit ScpB [Treponema sp.]|nr:SMC-Scp complex subunit ScpB [Spirochaetia bacterium]MDD7698596.1 SMC-Scp complex subunit ScpB [Spirochaetia bacterium]